MLSQHNHFCVNTRKDISRGIAKQSTYTYRNLKQGVGKMGDVCGGSFLCLWGKAGGEGGAEGAYQRDG